MVYINKHSAIFSWYIYDLPCLTRIDLEGHLIRGYEVLRGLTNPSN